MTHPILDLPMGENDANAETVRGYFKALLRQILIEDEGFSGKRPFGNSGWFGDLEAALVKGKAVKGKIDEYGDVEKVDSRAALKKLLAAVEAL